MTRFLVHNHDYDPTCRERTVAGRLVGACLPDPDYVGPTVQVDPFAAIDAQTALTAARAAMQGSLGAQVAANAERRAAGPEAWGVMEDIVGVLATWMAGYTHPVEGPQEYVTVHDPAVEDPNTFVVAYAPTRYEDPTRAYRVTVSIEEVQP